MNAGPGHDLQFAQNAVCGAPTQPSSGARRKRRMLFSLSF
jgi:hypothetical protein